MQLTVEPASGLIDTTPVIHLSGADAATANVTVSVTDGQGHQWAFRKTYPVTGGALDIADPAEPWTGLAFADTGQPPVIFMGNDTGLDFTVTVRAGANEASAVVHRIWGRDLHSEEIAGEGWILKVYRPASTTEPRPGVIVVPGTMVGQSVLSNAALIASHGYVSAVLYYTQRPGLPEAFKKIPIEAISTAMATFADLDYVNSDAVAVHSASVGTQTALSALSRAPRINPKAIVLVAPSHVVFQAVSNNGPPPKASALTFEGNDLDYVPVKAEKLLGQLIKISVRKRFSKEPVSPAIATTKSYEAGLRDTKAVAAATIPVEKISCPMLILAGDHDLSYPAAPMAHSLINRRRENGVGGDDELHIFPGVGHFIRPPLIPTTVDQSDGLISGGDPAAIGPAQRTAWDATLRFLARHVGT